jgi:hypothetical protein
MEGKMARKLLAALLAGWGAAMLLSATHANASDWVEMKSPEQLRALHTNKTFRSKTYSGEPSTRHFRADGKGLIVVGGSRLNMSWRVEGQGLVCYSSEAKQRYCYRVQQNARKPSEIMLLNVPGEGGAGFAPSVFATVEDGIPQF